MNKLVELYQRKTGFSEYRREQMAQVEHSAEADQLKELRARKARVVAEIDAQIAQVQLKLAAQGQLTSATARRAMRTEELRTEKRELDHEFALAVQDLKRRGNTISDIAGMCGASSQSVFYQALNYAPPETVKLSMTTGSFKPHEHEFEYSDVTSVHRYALNATRQIVKMHDTADPDNVVYIRRQDGEPILGDHTLMANYSSERVDTLAEILDGEAGEVPNLRTRANPYRGV